MVATSGLKTYEDLCRMPDDGKRYELIAGETVPSSAPTWFHQAVVGRLYQWLADWIEPRGLGRVGVAPLAVHLSVHNVVQPDVVYVSKARYAMLIENGTSGPPDLVVEVLSPSNCDMDESRKLRLYERSGIAEYWLVDAVDKTFRTFTLTGGRYQPIPLDGKVFRSLAVPGLEIDLTRLFQPLP